MLENIQKESLNVNQLVGKKNKCVVVEGDVIVPDIKPDIITVISSNANCYTYKREIMENKIRLDGNINLYIVYLSSNGENRSLNTILDFSENIEFENLNSNMNLNENVTIKSIETKILNERKINIKVNLEIEVSVYKSTKIDFINDLNSVENAEILEENINIMALKGCGLAKASAKENVNIDNIDEIVEIFKVDINVSNKENKNSYNKVLAKADVDLNIMYLTEDDRINTVKATIPIMGFVDMEGVSDENICKTDYKMRNMLIKPNTKEEHSIYVEIDYDICTNVYENMNMNIPVDIYGLRNNITFSKKDINLLSILEDKRNTLQIKENVNIPSVSKIYDANCKTNITNKRVYDNKVNFEGEIEITFLFETIDNNTLNTKTLKIPFNKIIDCNKNEDIELTLNICDENFIINSDDNVECILECECIINGGNDMSLTVIDDIEIEECDDENYFSMVIYFVKPKDTLWNIAKQFKSTVENIKFVNSIEDEKKLKVGDKLYISRCN